MSLLLWGGLHFAFLLLPGSCGQGRSTWPVLLFLWGFNGKSVFWTRFKETPSYFCVVNLSSFGIPACLCPLKYVCSRPQKWEG